MDAVTCPGAEGDAGGASGATAGGPGSARRGPGAQWSATVVARRQLSPAAFELEFTRPSGFTFSAGQHIRIRLDAGERDYSLISAPAHPTLALCVRQVTDPGVASALAQLGPGDLVTFTGPRGHFIFRPSARPAVLVATGTGIAPFVAMARDGLRGFVLLHGVREVGELYFAAELAAAARSYVACVTRPDPAAPCPGTLFGGRVTAYLRTQLAPAAFDFYLCGGGEMIRDATLLVDERFAGSLVYQESYF